MGDVSVHWSVLLLLGAVLYCFDVQDVQVRVIWWWWLEGFICSVDWLCAHCVEYWCGEDVVMKVVMICLLVLFVGQVFVIEVFSVNMVQFMNGLMVMMWVDYLVFLVVVEFRSRVGLLLDPKGWEGLVLLIVILLIYGIVMSIEDQIIDEVVLFGVMLSVAVGKEIFFVGGSVLIIVKMVLVEYFVIFVDVMLNLIFFVVGFEWVQNCKLG